MARITINNLGIEYDLVGKPGDPAVVLTPGGRYSKDIPGFPELASELAAGGRRVLLWDRPNCGASDLTFDVDSESELQAQTLIALVRELKLGPAALVGGSAGSRASLIAAARAPEAFSHLVICWISGGPVGLAILVYNYCCNSAFTANKDGMAAVVNLPDWADQIKRNPKARDFILAQDPQKFVQTMDKWAATYNPPPGSPVPGMTVEDFKRITAPTLVFRSGASDLHHTRRTSEWIHELIPHSRMAEPPWGDREWLERQAFAAKNGGVGHFAGWPKLAPQILDFIKK